MIKYLRYILLLAFLSGGVQATDLKDALQIAFDNNFDFKSKVETFNADFAYKGLANSYLLPQLSLQGNAALDSVNRNYATQSGANRSYTFTDSQNYGLSLNLVQPLYNPTAWAYYSQGKLMAQRAQIVLDKEKNNLMLRVAEGYFAVLAAQDDLESSKAQIEYLNKYMQEISQKASVGQSRKVDIDQVRAQYQLAKYNNLLLENNLKVQMDALNKMLNTNITEISRLKGDISNISIEEQDMDKWKAQSREQNLDILSTQLAVMLAEEDIKVSSSSYYPTINLVGSMGVNGGRDPTINDRFTGRNASVGLTLNMSLYGGGATSTQTKQAKYRKSSADFALRELENNIENLTVQYYLNVMNGQSQIEALNQSLISSERFLQAAQQSYTVGLKTTTDVLIATDNFFSSRRDYTKSKYNYLLSILALRAVSGEISDKDIALINSFLE
ncbi:MAG: TolC family outer membrane protein [Alphaproteobacteria bacterium]|jgi:outer membrane protein|nr:TolC family outer membrane protein [Alphaproteobacteria bacterium]